MIKSIKPYSLLYIASLLIIFLFDYLVRVFIITAYFDNNSLSKTITMVVWTFVINLIIVLYIFMILKKSGLNICSELKITIKIKDIFLGIFAGFCILLCAFVLIYLNFNIDSGRPSVVEPIVSNSNSLTLFVFAFYMVIYVPFVEEIIFRGYLWRILEEKNINKIIIIILTSFLFAAVHLDIQRFGLLFISGMIDGFLRMRTNRMGPSIISHTTTNVIALLSYL